MMVRYALVCLMACCLLGGAHAQAPTRIGVVDFDVVRRESRVIRAAVADAEAALDEEKARLDRDLARLERLRDELDRKRSVMTREDIDAEQAVIRELRDAVEDRQYQINRLLDNFERDVIAPEVRRMMRIVAEVAEREQYDLVLPADAVLFFSPAVDLTPLVIKALDTREGGAAPDDRPTGTAGREPAPHDAARSAAPPEPPGRPENSIAPPSRPARAEARR